MTQTVLNAAEVTQWATGLSRGQIVKPLMPRDGRVLVGKKVGGKLQRALAVAAYPETWQAPSALMRENLSKDVAYWYAPAPLTPTIYRLEHTHRRRGTLVRHWQAYVLVVPEHVTLTKDGVDPRPELARFGLGHEHVEEFLLVAGYEFAAEAATLAMTAGAAFGGDATKAAGFLQRNIQSSTRRQRSSLKQIGFQPSNTEHETIIALFYGAYEFAKRAWRIS